MPHCRLTRRRWAGPVLAWAAASVVTPVSRAAGVGRSWAAAGNGGWSTAANWSPASVPAAGDAVTISAPAAGTRTVTYDFAGPAVSLASLLLDGAGTGVNPPPTGETLLVPAGALSIAGTLNVGKNIRGTVAQTGGAVTVGTAATTATEALNLGYSDGYGIGTYQLSGGSLTVNGLERVGEFGTGAFNQSGGTHAVTAAGTGILVGNDVGPGAFTLTGGTTTAASMAVGYSPPTAGHYGTLTVAGTGQLNLSGGLIVYPSAPTGRPNALVLSGQGSITAASLSIAPGTLNWSGGSITVTNSDVAIDLASSGSNLGPSLTLGAGQSLTVAQFPSRPGFGNRTEIVGRYYSGTVNQTGGTNTATDVAVGQYGTGVYNLSGGTLTAVNGESLTTNAQGTVNQTGGTNGATVLEMGNPMSSSAAVYNLSGGTLAVPQTFTVHAKATFTQTGGTLAGPTWFYSSGRTTLGGVQLWPAGATLAVDAGTVTVATDAGASAPATPPLTVTETGGTVTFTATQHLAGLTVGPAAAAVVAGPAGTVVVTGSVALTNTSSGTWQGLVDVSAGNAVIVRGGSLSTLTSQAAQGFSGGRWNGSGGLVSTSAAADASHLTAVGVIPNAVGGNALYPTFDGQTVTAADVLVRATFYGDANLDGQVTAADYSRVDAGFVGRLTGWINGDFNYDGAVDGSDYALADNAFNAQTSAAAPAAVVATAAVPEPASALTAVAAFVGLACRRRSGRRLPGTKP